jgi:molybdate transport system substrate-binding protein
LKRLLLLILLFSTILFANSINIAVAANVSYAIPKLIKEFNKQYPNIKIKTTLGGSGKLTAQIKHKAPYDIFMSANMAYPNALYQDGIAIIKPTIYAKGALSLFRTKKIDQPLNIDILKNKNIRKIAIANPKTAPYGKASIEALKNLNIYNKIKNKFIYGESISQTVMYTLSAADIGLIASSALYSSKMTKYKKNIHYINIDPTLYKPINQGIVILKRAKNNSDVKKFYDFILSKKAKNILKEFGYIVK